MLCCLEEVRRYKKCGSHDGQLWHSNCKRIYVLHMTPYKNGQPQQVTPIELPQNIEWKISPTNMSCLNSCPPPPPPHPWNYVQCLDYVMKWKIIETLPLHWSSLQWVSVLLHTDWQGWCIKVFFWKTRHECAMTKKGHILINLRQFEDQMPLVCKFKVWRVRKY